MSGTVSKIKYAMSLRTPQEEALSYLDAISTHCDYKRDDKETIEAAASEYSENNRKVRTKFDFPSFGYNMATGIGKTRLMGACIYYLYKTKGYKHFFILAPGNTIYDKLRNESNPAYPKYIFKGLEAEMGRPRVWDSENYDQYPVKYEQGSLFVDQMSEIQLFIFNIGKIFNSKTDTQFNFHKFKETLGASFADVLAQFDDLVICMDEAHHYYAPASMKAINYLKPILGLEFTATPKSPSNVIYSYDVARGAAEGYLKIPVVMGRSNIAGYSQDDIEEMKIRDGLTLHEHRKTVLREYCTNNELDYVKPIVLIACKDTDHAKKIRALIDSDDFMNGKYKGKVIEIHSKQTGEESEENVRLLLSIESVANPIEIVLHVYKLKEGWDVNNLFTIIPLNAAKISLPCRPSDAGCVCHSVNRPATRIWTRLILWRTTITVSSSTKSEAATSFATVTWTRPESRTRNPWMYRAPLRTGNSRSWTRRSRQRDSSHSTRCGTRRHSLKSTRHT